VALVVVIVVVVVVCSVFFCLRKKIVGVDAGGCEFFLLDVIQLVKSRVKGRRRG